MALDSSSLTVADAVPDKVLSFNLNFGYNVIFQVKEKGDEDARARQYITTTPQIKSDGTVAIRNMADHSVEPFQFNLLSRECQSSWKVSLNRIVTWFDTGSHTIRIEEYNSRWPIFNAIASALIDLDTNEGCCKSCAMKDWTGAGVDAKSEYLFGMHLCKAAFDRRRKECGLYIGGHCDFSSVAFLDFCRLLYTTQPMADKPDVTQLMVAFRDRFDETLTHVHWSKLALEHVSLRDYKRLLKAYGTHGSDKYGKGALHSALSSGRGDFIQATLEYQSATETSGNSMAEKQMSDDYLRWNESSKVFVDYMRRLCGERKTRDCLSTLKKAFLGYLNDQCDIGSVDVMGLLWQADAGTKTQTWNAIKDKSKAVLNYDTLHKSQCDWVWFRDTLLRHPLWLEELHPDEASEMATAKKKAAAVFSAEETKEETKEEVKYDSGELKPVTSKKGSIVERHGDSVISKKATVDSDYEDAGGDGMEDNIRYDWLRSLVDAEENAKKGSEIRDAMGALIEESGFETWKALCDFGIETGCELRQDAIANGPKAHWNESELAWILLNSSSFEFDPFKACDLHAFVTDLSTSAHYLCPAFEELMTAKLSRFGHVQMGPVKSERRIRSKTESDYSDPRHYKWPHAAHVLDVIRCSLTVDDIESINGALSAFASECNATLSSLQIVRCKNGFQKYARECYATPASYCDVKLNVTFRHGGRAVVGEVQFLLRCILESKRKGHELYEVSRNWRLVRGAHLHLRERNAWRRKLLLCAADSKALEALLARFPHAFNVASLTQPLADGKGVAVSALQLIARNMASWKGQCEERLVHCLVNGSSAIELATVIEHCDYPKWWHPMVLSPTADLWARVLLPTEELKAECCAQSLFSDNPLLVYLLKRALVADKAVAAFVPKSAHFWPPNTFILDRCLQFEAWHSLHVLSRVVPAAVFRNWKRAAAEELTQRIEESKSGAQESMQATGVWEAFGALLSESEGELVTAADGGDAPKKGLLQAIQRIVFSQSEETKLKSCHFRTPLQMRVEKLLKDVKRTVLWRAYNPMDFFALFQFF